LHDDLLRQRRTCSSLVNVRKELLLWSHPNTP